MTEQQVSLHSSTTQVKIAVAQAERFGHLGLLINVEGRCAGRIQDLHLLHGHFYVAAGQLGILQTRRTSLYSPLHLKHILAEVTMVPKSTVKLEDKEAEQMLRLMESLEDLDDVQKVYSNFDIPEETLEKIGGA